MNGTEEELELKSPLKMGIIITISIFVIEYGLMILFNLLPHIPGWIEELADSSALTILLLPIIYYFVFRPMASYITERRQAEELVKSLVEETQQKAKDLSALVEKLTQSEEKYRTIVEHAGDMIWTLDTEGRFIFANKSAEDISGYKIEDWVGKPFAALIAEDLPTIMEVFRKTLKGEPQRFEATIIHADGRRVVLSVNSAPLYSGKQVVGTINFGRDITVGKKMEEALKKSRKEWESTFDAISDPIFIHDKEFRIVRANLAYQQASGISLEEMAGQPYYDVFPKMEGPFSMCHKALKLQEEEEEEEEVFLPYLERTILVRFYPIKNDEGKFLYSIHTMEDITERKKAEKEITERIDELERFRKATVTREFRIKELRDENEELKRKLGLK